MWLVAALAISEGGVLDRREIDAVLSVLAFALGPLGEADLLALAGC
jgi:3-hydroxyacyl-CoA dehydrogenase